MEIGKIILGIVIGIIGVASLIIFFKRSNEDDAYKYDERQLREQGMGYKLGFYTLLFYMGVYGLVVEQVMKIRVFDTFTGGILGVCIAMVVHSGYCIWKDAYISIREKQDKVMKKTAKMSVFCILYGLLLLDKDRIMIDGVLTGRVAYFMLGISGIVVFIIYEMKVIYDRKVMKDSLCEK